MEDPSQKNLWGGEAGAGHRFLEIRMPSVFVHSAPGFEDYTFHLVNALSSIARVGYLIDAKQKERFGSSLSSAITPVVFHRPRRRHAWGFWEMYRASVAIKQFKPEVLHVQGNGLWENVLLRMIRNVPVINTVHDPILHIDYRNFLNNVFLRDAVHRADGWVVHSESLKQILLNQFKVNSDRVLIHPLGVHDYYCQYAPVDAQREQYILFFGEPRINKGIDLLVNAFRSVKDRLANWNIVIAGRGPVESGLADSIRGLGDRVIYLNRFITDPEVAGLFARAGIVALPYRHGSQSGVLGIAAAFGCPVLATPVGNMPEIMENGKHALFVEPESGQSLAEGLLTLAYDAELREKLGNNLGELARSAWSWKAIAKRTVEFYSKFS